MSSLLPWESKSSFINDPDPYSSCHRGIDEHPHYHDCNNCNHAKYATCEYGRIRVRELWFDGIHNKESRKNLEKLGIDPHETLPEQFWK